MTTLYTLTDGDRDTLSNLDQTDVIATGPWAKGEASLPHRAVIREVGNQFIVHNQIIGDGESGSAHYSNGTYIHKADGNNQLEVALAAFDKRVRRHHNLPTFTRQ